MPDGVSCGPCRLPWSVEDGCELALVCARGWFLARCFCRGQGEAWPSKESTGVDGHTWHIRRLMKWRQRWRQVCRSGGENWFKEPLHSFLRGINLRPVRMHLWPQMMVRPQYEMVHPIFVKLMIHPALQSITTERSDCEARPGMMWAAWVLGGRAGRSRVHVWLDGLAHHWGVA